MVTIELNYENDRGTPEPKYHKGLPRLWWITARGQTTLEAVSAFMIAHKNKKLMTSLEAEDAVVALGKKLGVKDTTNAAEWKKHGVVVKAPRIIGFVNWPDPSMS